MTGGTVILSDEEKIAWLRLTRSETVGAITFDNRILK